MSAFTLYLILMLDRIQGSMALALTLSLIALVFSLVAAFILNDSQKMSWNRSPESQLKIESELAIAKKVMRYSAATVLLVFPVFALVPSTKTAAAIQVIPALVNNETIQLEAGEIYDLAKSALKNLAEKEK